MFEILTNKLFFWQNWKLFKQLCINIEKEIFYLPFVGTSARYKCTNAPCDGTNASQECTFARYKCTNAPCDGINKSFCT